MNLKIGFRRLTLVLSILAFIILAVAPDYDGIDDIWERLSVAFIGFVDVWLLYLFIRYIIVGIVGFVVKGFKKEDK